MRLLIATGEASGDAHAAKVARCLRAEGARVTAVGGPELAAAGAELVAHIDDLAVLGFVEVLSRLPRLLALESRLEKLLRRERFDLFVPVDYPDFNFRLAARARRAGVPVLYYIGPQVWAWRPGRLAALRRSVRHVALILPFEKRLYDAAGVPASFVGHPLLDDPPSPPGEPDRDLGLFPGSRPQEVERHLPVLLEAAKLLRARRSGLRLLVSQASTAPGEWMRAALQAHGFDPETELSTEPARLLMARARVLLVASGTATLEAALARRPFAVLYRTSALNWALARRLVRVPHVALCNLVADAPVVREFLQGEAQPEALAAEAAFLLDDEPARRRILDALQDVRTRLGPPGASARVARLALDIAAGRDLATRQARGS